MYKNKFKRLIDIFFSLFAIIIISPIFVVVFILIKLDSNGPIFFTQNRQGKNGKAFKILKLRTMTNKVRNEQREIFSGDSEITRIGAILRRLKIDELPQIFNVFIGNMSIVGPRPGLFEQIKDYNEIGKVRLKVRPGLTGLAQINGNIFLTWPERWKYDKLYVEKCSFVLDIKIIFKTFLIVIFGEKKFVKNPNV